MAFRNVLSWPDPALKEKSEPVVDFNEDVRKLAADLYDTLNVVTGVGIAAPQIGVHKRCVIVDAAQCSLENPTPEEGFPPNIMVLVNPQLTLSGPNHKWVEACLSVPDSRGLVERQQYVTVKYNSLNGSEHTLQLDWPASGVFQHECDHLDGVLYVDRMPKLARDMLLTKITKKRKKISQVREMMLAAETRELNEIHGVPSHRPALQGADPAKKKRDRILKNKQRRLNRGRKK